MKIPKLFKMGAIGEIQRALLFHINQKKVLFKSVNYMVIETVYLN